MDAKFRIGPMIESGFSQIFEGSRNAKKRPGSNFPVPKNEQRQRTMALRNGKTYDNLAKGKETLREPESIEHTKETRPRSGVLPYAEVPPIRPTLRPVAATSDSVDQTDRQKLSLNRDKMFERPVYKSKAPVEAGLDIEKLVESVLDLEINLPLRNLAGISVAIQKEIKKQMTKTRQEQVSNAIEVNCLDEPKQFTDIAELPIACSMVMSEVSDEIPEGHLVASDPVLQYLAENQGAKLSDLIVARTSEPLRAIYANVNGVGQEECLIDNGSSIVSMAKETAIQKGLTWDPNLKINMESATNHVVETLGLARNVCFKIGGINVYLQVHIFENPPYKILLGRPFDAFATSVVRTAADGSSELVLTDPNNGQVSIVPTYKRGEGPEQMKQVKSQDF